MTNLKRSFFWAAFYLGVIFVLGEFDYSNSPIIDFAKYFYLTVMVAVPVTLFIPSISKVHVLIPIIIWGAIYFAILQTLDRSTSAPVGNVSIILLEFITLEIGVWLAYQLAGDIARAESLMDAMALGAFPNRTEELASASQSIKAEITRSRRYHRPLGLIVVQANIEDHEAVKELIRTIQLDLWNRFSFARIGQIIDESIRQTDMVFRDHGGRFVILCPETDYANTGVLAQRVCDSIKTKSGVRVHWGVAVFPDDALTFEDLLHQARSRMVHPVLQTNKIEEEIVS
jgi:Diguanylate cyclase, GGDEF domain